VIQVPPEPDVTREAGRCRLPVLVIMILAQVTGWLCPARGRSRRAAAGTAVPNLPASLSARTSRPRPPAPAPQPPSRVPGARVPGARAQPVYPSPGRADPGRRAAPDRSAGSWQRIDGVSRLLPY